MLVSTTNLDHIKPLLIDYVEKSPKGIELQWDPKIKELQLPFDPHLEINKEKSSHYFLQVAAIDTAELVLRSENARALMIYLYKILGDDIFEKNQNANISEIIQDFNKYYKLGSFKERIPHVIDSVNRYVKDLAGGSLVEYAKSFDFPVSMVKEISDNI